jgi:Initiator Replication protein
MGHLTARQKTNFDGFPKAAELIEITGTHALEAADRAIQNRLFQHAHDSGRMTEPDAVWEMTFAELRRPLGKHESNDRLRESLDRIMDVKVVVHYVSPHTGKPRTLKTRLLTATDTDDEDFDGATVRYGIPNELRRVLARSSRWGRVKCQITYAMTSKYAIALYELVCLRRHKESFIEVFSEERFRELLGVPPDAYPKARDFRRFVVEPAVIEVNGLSDIRVDVELRRRHSRAAIDEIPVCWRRPEPDEFRAAIQERNRHKAGRMARLRGTVEKAEPVGPRLPSAADHAELAAKVEKMRAEEAVE